MRCALLVALLLTLGACTTERAAPPRPTAQPGGAEDRVYVSLGDSYATGYRPEADGAPAGSSRDGFAHVVAARTGLRLINLGCSGVTSGQLRAQPGCSPGSRAVDAPDTEGTTQLAAAVRELRANEGRVELVTVVIGGNDLAPCARERDATTALTCAATAVAGVSANLAAILPALRDAAGDARIVGLTYPDVFLGAWVSPEFPDGEDLARRSIPIFRNFFNTALAAEYEKIGATFVDITAATGGYEPLTERTQDPEYGPIPTSVARICVLTYFCDHTDVHPTPAGHAAIAEAVLTATDR